MQASSVMEDYRRPNALVQQRRVSRLAILMLAFSFPAGLHLWHWTVVSGTASIAAQVGTSCFGLLFVWSVLQMMFPDDQRLQYERRGDAVLREVSPFLTEVSPFLRGPDPAQSEEAGPLCPHCSAVHTEFGADHEE